MSNKILYSPKEGTTGFWGIRGLPEEPNWNLTSLSNDVKKRKWRETLESCKSNSLEIVNPEDAGFHVSEITGLVTHRPKKSSRILNPVKPGDLFDLPEGYEFKEECIIQESTGEWVLTHEDMYNRFPEDRRKKVIRLVKTETKAVREDGYYWIRPAGGFWIIGQWYQKNEAFTFLDGKKLMSWPEHSLEVNETRIYRIPQPEPEESQAEEFTDEEYAEGFADGQEFIKSSLREEIEKQRKEMRYEYAVRLYDSFLETIDSITPKK
ncbi:MAG TPA: hypothetical protein VGK59_18680 [Ohtaekwangia sp.]